ncbi:hypothetical protein ACFP81_10810 [Deinococcus lacus]|uniref:Uncharacterized protein n=1 Tax=Deinococcus lacus TaxID=392561 RepID=A0ABW1YDV0_9DEIO
MVGAAHGLVTGPLHQLDRKQQGQHGQNQGGRVEAVVAVANSQVA